MEVKSNKLQTKDLINVGIFTAIYFVIFFAGMMLGYIPIFIPLYFQPVGSAKKYPQIMHLGILAIAGDDILSPQTEVPFSYPCGTVRSMQRGASPLCAFIVEPDAGLSADFEAGYDV